MSKREKPVLRTSIGGQALIEGIMMKGPKKAALAVRKKNGEIETECKDLPEKKWYQKCPFVRGIFNFVAQLKDGMSYMNKSMEISGYMEEDDEEPSKFEKWLEKTFGKSIMSVVSVIGAVFGVGLAVLLFIFLPTWLFTGFQALFGDTDISPFRSLFEGVIKILIYILYLWLTSLMKDIRRTYEYHGAEHKTIAAYEAGEELTVENVKKHIRFHPRCGTSFMILMLLLGIIVGFFIPFSNPILRTAVKLLCIPIIVNIGYEVQKACARHDNMLCRIITAPGLWMQRITVKEPDDKMIEAAIAALQAVIPENGEDLLK